MRRLDFVVGSHMYLVARSSDSALTILTIIKYDDDADTVSDPTMPVYFIKG